MKRRFRIYIDTSIIGGCLDPQFKDVSLMLIERFKKGELTAVISDVTKLELKKAPSDVQSVIKEIPDKNIEYIELTEEAATLANRYISDGVLDETKIADAQHIAIATVHNVDLIVSWNFKHIVNINRIRGFNSVNLKMGYPMVDIRSPQEVISYD